MQSAAHPAPGVIGEERRPTEVASKHLIAQVQKHHSSSISGRGLQNTQKRHRHLPHERQPNCGLTQPSISPRQATSAGINKGAEPSTFSAGHTAI
ncbi:hypothetical protein Nepgr_031362 [Nepenthes gracilis]|uniref:Uncharacterized protein n=1 Tax=Nepenthes gracilis TaxID=150966 RepID=A0AAD3Y702_NEPGR|nr:hypothetical protein Nepgr_031362 [Nepenthes gracilis]